MIESISLKLAAIALVVGPLAWIVYTRTLHPLSKVPGPFLPSITRLWLTYHVKKGDMDTVQRALHLRYGPMVRIAPDEVACSDPDAIPKIYRTQAPLTKSDFYPIWNNAKLSKYNDNFSQTDERMHSDRRRLVNNVYSMSTVLTLETYIDKCNNLFLQRMGEFADTGAKVDLGAWLQWYAFDVIGESFFGRMFGFMQHSHDHGSYIQSLDTVLPVMAAAAASAPLTRFLMLGTSMINSTTRQALKALDHIEAAARSCVKERRDQELISGDKTSKRTDLLHYLLDVVHQKGEKVDFGIPEVEKEAYVALFAGSDTTAIALRAIFYYLLKNPACYKELQDEVDQAISNGKLSSPPRYAEAFDLPLLRATVKEAMRMHPSVGLTMPRHAGPDGLELCGIYIPPGWTVGMNAAVVGYDKRIYGADADRFRPSRWLEGDVAAMDRCNLAFGAGTRTCIGKNISLSEIYKLVPLVLRNFSLRLVEPEKEWTTENFWFNKQSGINVYISRREKEGARKNL